MTLQQRQAALAVANSVRIPRAKLRHEIHDLTHHEGIERLVTVLWDAPAEVRTVRVADILLWPRRMRKERVDKIMKRMWLGSGKTVEELTARQVWELSGLLRGEL